MFDETVLNQQVAGTFCNKTASWITLSGTTEIMLMFDIEPGYDEDGVISIGSEVFSAGCMESTAAGMRRGDVIEMSLVQYKVLDVQPDGNGWITIALDKL